MPNCFSYAVKSNLNNDFPESYKTAFDTLYIELGKPQTLNKNADWQSGSALLAYAMKNNKKTEGTAFLRTITGRPNLNYTKRTTSSLGPTNNAANGTIVLGTYQGGGEHYFRREGGNWQGVAVVGGTSVEPVTYQNGTAATFTQKKNNTTNLSGSVNYWWIG